MTNTEAQTQHFIILQKIKELGFVEGKTLTEIADNLGTTRQNIGSIKTKIEAHQDCIEGNFKSHYKKIKLKKFSAFDKLNPSIAKFLLSAEYGLSEKTKTENTGSIQITSVPLTKEELNFFREEL